MEKSVINHKEKPECVLMETCVPLPSNIAFRVNIVP